MLLDVITDALAQAAGRMRPLPSMDRPHRSACNQKEQEERSNAGNGGRLKINVPSLRM